MNSMKKLQKPGCVAYAVSILGDKWTPLLVKALATDSMRFCQLQLAAGGINPRTLSAKLSKLEKEGIIKKVVYPQIPPKTDYSLTQKGKDLIPILQSMAHWGDRYNAAT
jgi:DNA-binding HxlR family transcriptional regulator